MLGIDEVIQRCVLEHEREAIIDEAHKGGSKGHYQGEMSARNIMQA